MTASGNADLMSPAEAASLLGIKVNTLGDRDRAGRLPEGSVVRLPSGRGDRRYVRAAMEALKAAAGTRQGAS